VYRIACIYVVCMSIILPVYFLYAIVAVLPV
jgi:hypothetical protein